MRTFRIYIFQITFPFSVIFLDSVFILLYDPYSAYRASLQRFMLSSRPIQSLYVSQLVFYCRLYVKLLLQKTATFPPEALRETYENCKSEPISSVAAM